MIKPPPRLSSGSFYYKSFLNCSTALSLYLNASTSICFLANSYLDGKRFDSPMMSCAFSFHAGIHDFGISHLITLLFIVFRVPVLGILQLYTCFRHMSSKNTPKTGIWFLFKMPKILTALDFYLF